MKLLNRVLVLLCALVLLAGAPVVLANEAGSSAHQDEFGIVLNIWEFIQNIFGNLTETLPGQSEDPAGTPGEGDEPLPPEQGGDSGGLEPVAEQFPFPDPNG